MRCQDGEESLEKRHSSLPFSLPAYMPACGKYLLRSDHVLGIVSRDMKDKEVYNAYSTPSRHLQYGRRQEINSSNKTSRLSVVRGQGEEAEITTGLYSCRMLYEGRGELELELKEDLN